MVTIVLAIDPTLTTPLGDAEFNDTGKALLHWINTHPGPSYSQGAYGLQCLPRNTAIPAPADRVWPVILKDTSDVPGALGYHTVSVSGHPVAYVFIGDCAKYGVPWSAVASHEICEVMVNRFVYAGVRCLFNGQPAYAFQEACDPVEDSSYAYTDGIKTIQVSNFVTPNYWRPGQPGPYDHMGRLTAPLTPSQNGRQTFEIVSGTPQTVDPTGRTTPADPDDARISRAPVSAALPAAQLAGGGRP